jgi:hypothetical protein
MERDPNAGLRRLEILPLAEEHLIFKWVSIDPNIKCSEIVASINVTQVTAAVITSVMISLRDTLPIYDLEIRMATSDAAGCNWLSFGDTLSTHTHRDALPSWISDKYPAIDCDVRCLTKDPVTMQGCIFIPNMLHLTKNIVTSLELSSSQKSKQKLRIGKVPISLNMIKEVWLKKEGASGQLHATKLSAHHFEKSAYSWMIVLLATQVLSASIAVMISNAIDDDDIVLNLRVKGMYCHICDLCTHWNGWLISAMGKTDRTIRRMQWIGRGNFWKL